MLAIGLMSGTSLDGVDACLVEIKGIFNKKYSIKHFTYLAYDEPFKNRIKECSSLEQSNVQKICSMNVEVSKKYIEAISLLLKKANVDIKKIKFIAMHGQTVWHNPNNLDGYESSTLQLGDPSVIANYFNTLVISNFRTMDMAAGGSGAPLVPFANYCLYKSNTRSIALQNIGGISNVTYIPKKGDISDLVAFDTGPGNMLIDGAMKKLYSKAYDESGLIAKSGTVINEVLNELMNDEYLNAPIPKSTGREKYNEKFLDNVISKCLAITNKKEDVISTLAAYTADSIVYEYNKFLSTIDLMVVSGGGAYNEFIIDRLREHLPCKVEISTDADSLEALSFAILGYHTLKQKPSNVPMVTGAKKPVILGNITNPKVR